MTTLGEFLIDLLASYDVDRVFGIPGVHTIELYRGLANSSITHYTPRHEQGAGFMADGYARISGKPGVCFVITGPGLTNIATAMAQAYADSIPMLVISGVNKTQHLGHGNGNLHELPNQSAFAEQVSSFSYSVTHPDDLPKAMARAFAVFSSSRPRPVHIEIPIDLMSASADHLTLPTSLPTPSLPCPDEATIEQVAAHCLRATSPLLIIGGGVKGDGRSTQQLAERLDCPVIMTVNARGLLPEDHPLAIPASPSLESVRSLIEASDLVIAMGTELGPTDFDMYENQGFAISGTLIRVDIDPLQLQRNGTPDVCMVGDADLTMRQLVNALPEIPQTSSGKEGANRARKTKKDAFDELSTPMQHQVQFLDTIKTTLPGAIIVGDSTQPVYAGNLYYSPDSPKGWVNSATGFGTLGYALPAAIGAQLAAPQRPVICLTGDGGIQFTLGELGSAMDAGANIIVIVWNNDGYQEIKNFMLDNNITPEGVTPSSPDFPSIAKAYGLYTEHLSSKEDLPKVLKRVQAEKRPALIQIEEALFTPE
ncbi:5-guanidino-2-oxopentanoate decarboxylase [Kiloniella majae]|uniref:5-guanidino-2-oxopentanoate decarboxylase n=1 Tax=Kiloniella majae TaxID=1938558 RepID=UPI000A277806|nr:5-guanidino-2-oxopentanoate decarboxylase [Kiloniella majae]